MTKVTITNDDDQDGNQGVLQIVVDGETHTILPGRFIQVETLPDEKITVGDGKALTYKESTPDALPPGWGNEDDSV